jgi:phenylacetate-CoA ligase
MKNWIATVYGRSPVLVQHALISAYGWKLARVRYGPTYERYLGALLKSQYYSEAELAELQNEKLRELIAHCYENVPYYSRLMRELRLTPSDFKNTADLPKLPVLDKETVRSQPQLFYARNYLRAPCEIVSTSGTTGATLRIRVDAEGRRRNYAFFGRLKVWAGINPGARTAVFAGRTIVPMSAQSPPFWRYNVASHALLFSSYHLSGKTIPAYLSKLRDWNPQLVDSYPSSISILAQHVLENASAAPEPQAVITSSETLLPDQGRAIAKAFKTRVFDQYGAAEQSCFISQCEMGSYHAHPEFGLTEFLADSSDGSHPVVSQIVATGFTNWAMPLLRYQTGDAAVPLAGDCPCGRKFPMLEQLLGRLDDVIVTPDGRRVGRLDPVFKGLETIRRAQIVQEDLARIRILIVAGNGFSTPDQDSFCHELQKRLGSDMQLIVEQVNDIPLGPGGKFRSVVSRVGRDGSFRSLCHTR